VDDADLRSGVIAGTSAYLLWGALTVYWKQLDGFEAFDLIGWRVTSSSVLMALLLTWRRRWKHLLPVLRDRRLLLRVCATAVLLTVNWTAYVYAVVHGHVIETALGYFITPLGAILVGVRVYGETLHRSQCIAVVLVLGAIGVLTVSYGHVPWLALAIAVSGACTGG
jgi:chloramphenicol-sensitive protein RarD